MKKLLLLLMMIASVASAHPRSDAELKALIVGTWTLSGEGGGGDKGSTYIYQEDGTMGPEVPNIKMTWYVKDGELVEIEVPIDRSKYLGKGQGYCYNFTILFLTKHEMLVSRLEKDKKTVSYYRFMYR
jgi:hypothetical protein